MVVSALRYCTSCNKSNLSSGNIFQAIGTYVNDALTSFGQARASATGATATEGISSITLSSALPVIAISGAIIYIVYKAMK